MSGRRGKHRMHSPEWSLAKCCLQTAGAAILLKLRAGLTFSIIRKNVGWVSEASPIEATTQDGRDYAAKKRKFSLYLPISQQRTTVGELFQNSGHSKFALPTMNVCVRGSASRLWQNLVPLHDGEQIVPRLLRSPILSLLRLVNLLRIIAPAVVLTFVLPDGVSKSCANDDTSYQKMEQRRLDIIFPETTNWINLSKDPLPLGNTFNCHADKWLNASLKDHGDSSLFVEIPLLKKIFDIQSACRNFQIVGNPKLSASLLYSGPTPGQEGNAIILWQKFATSYHTIEFPLQGLRLNAGPPFFILAVESEAGEPDKLKLLDSTGHSMITIINTPYFDIPDDFQKNSLPKNIPEKKICFYYSIHSKECENMDIFENHDAVFELGRYETKNGEIWSLVKVGSDSVYSVGWIKI